MSTGADPMHGLWHRLYRRIARAVTIEPPLARHEHYCLEHDHRWTCRDPRCIRHEATPCWRRWLRPKPEATA